MNSPSQLRSSQAESEHNRGLAFAQVGDKKKAIECFRAALAIDPQLFAALANLGTLLAEHGDPSEALALLKHAEAIRPDVPAVHNNLANLLAAIGDLDASEAQCRLSLQLQPDNGEALNALGNVLKDKGRLNEALHCFAHAAKRRPDLPQLAGNYLYTLHFHPAQTPASILAAHRQWAAGWVTRPDLKTMRYENAPAPHRRLRIGYVSPDLGDHPVGRFLLPLLQKHDRSAVEIFCYHNFAAEDHVTRKLQAHAHAWRNIAGLNDTQASDLVRADRIDILVDLAMHLRGSRLGLFHRKPAPVQVTYLAYCSTTGLPEMGYRLTDPILDPPGTDAFYTERSVRLPRSYWCYAPSEHAAPVNKLPAADRGVVTFCSPNNFCKVTPATLDAWRRLLAQVPLSRLLLHTCNGDHRQRVREFLGLDEARLIFVDRLPLDQYFKLYQQTDIALDPFPCVGGTTTCDALWMGVPVITLTGQTAVSRAGASILTNVGRTEWIAHSVDQYIDLATALASDLTRLQEIRATLRPQMMNSPLMDATTFARGVDDAYRTMWANWCHTRQSQIGQ